ncbi:BQ5605_C009g05680 [Microbotryum silenes-dioicae]|uniref:BQ5605_C009g05680 protein n=1 Tax=Microbotryum silenes-dioicae TaxID=796604 RepID=A0A2X0PF64_9BASI|nr:BQ5605_C009g05680 [Microbotryum silenes-dioicae]
MLATSPAVQLPKVSDRHDYTTSGSSSAAAAGRAATMAANAEGWATLPNSLDGMHWWYNRGLIQLNYFTEWRLVCANTDGGEVSVVFCAQFLNGFDDNLTAGLQALPSWHTALNHPSQSDIGLMNAVFYLGGLLSAPIAAYIADRFGRRWCVRWASLMMLAGTVIAVTAGIEPSSGYTLALIGSMYNLNYALGSFIVAWIIFGTTFLPNNWAWRIPTLLQIVPALYLTIVINFVPESPRWLMSKGREREAMSFLVAYHGNGDAHDALVLFEFEEMKKAIRAERAKGRTGSWLQLFATRRNRHRTAIVTLICSMQNLSGSAIVGGYYTQMLDLVGITSPASQTGINGGLTIAVISGALLGSYLVTRTPRRRLLLSSWIALIIVNVAFVVTAQQFVTRASKPAGVTHVVLLFLYLFIFFIPCGSLFFSYNVEVMPYSLRAQSQGLWAVQNKAISIFNGYVNAIALQRISWRYYLVYTGIMVVQLVLVYLLCVETKGYTLEEIEALFDGKTSKARIAETEVNKNENNHDE